MLNQFDLQYKKIIKDIMEHGFDDKNERTGHICRSLPGVTMQFDLTKSFPILTLRKIPIKLFVAEQLWFISGKKDLTWLQNFTRIWDDFAEDDNTIESAYGYRWRQHFGRDQLGYLIKLLKKEPSSRHGVILMWDPSEDGLGGKSKKNVPCPFTFTVQILGGKLHLHLVIRSNDMILGNPHDVAGFALLAHILAQKIGVEVGKLTVSISNAHIYDIHFKFAQELISREILHEQIKLILPKQSFERAEQEDQQLVTEIFENLKNQYNPGESLGKIKIVL